MKERSYDPLIILRQLILLAGIDHAARYSIWRRSSASGERRGNDSHQCGLPRDSEVSFRETILLLRECAD